ncbi:MAG: ferritin family protein [Bacteroidales bacterium]|jgi:rubrerythrin|nr:ferritin family protein [Bacteroidales bacterium]
MSELNTIKSILDFAIKQEQEAVDFYTVLAEKSSSKDMQQVFLQFAKEEIGHKARLTRIRDEQIFDWKDSAVADLKLADYMTSVEASPNMDYQDALIVAMNKEKNAYNLYLKLAERAPNQELNTVFLSLANEESKHKLRFEREYDDFVLRDN